MKKPKNFNFQSWIEMYDYLQKQPIRFDSYLICSQIVDGTMKTYRVTMRTVERNAWRELQALRLDERQSMIAIHELQAQPFYSELNQKCADLLFQLKINK